MNSPRQALSHCNSASDNQSDRHASIARRTWGKVASFLACDDGPTAVEYGVMLMLIIAVCLTCIQLLASNTQASFTNSANSVGNAISSSS